MTVDGAGYAKRPEAGAHLKARLADMAARADRAGQVGPAPVARIGGFAVEATATGASRAAAGAVVLRVLDAPVELSLSRDELADVDSVGLVARLEHRLRGLDDVLATAERDRERAESEAAAAKGRLGAPFPQEAPLVTLRGRQAEIEKELTPPDPEAAPVEPAAEPAASSATATGLVGKAYPNGPGAGPAPAGAPSPAHRGSAPAPVPARPSPHR
jgi:hypothetical protein